MRTFNQNTEDNEVWIYWITVTYTVYLYTRTHTQKFSPLLPINGGKTTMIFIPLPSVCCVAQCCLQETSPLQCSQHNQYTAIIAISYLIFFHDSYGLCRRLLIDFFPNWRVSIPDICHVFLGGKIMCMKTVHKHGKTHSNFWQSELMTTTAFSESVDGCHTNSTSLREKIKPKQRLTETVLFFVK